VLVAAGAQAASAKASSKTVFTEMYQTHEESGWYRPPPGDRSGYPRMYMVKKRPIQTTSTKCQ
jgi:hypothetical protein